MDSSFWLSLNGWTWLALAGCALVIPGVILESAEYVVKWSEKRKFLKFIRWIIGSPTMLEFLCFAKTLKKALLPVETLGFIALVIGLMVEIFGSFQSDVSQSRDNAELYAAAGVATNMAAQAMETAARFNFDAAEARKQAAILESNNLELQKKLMPRTISVEQMELFKKYMNLVSKKIPVRVSIGQEGFDTETFGKDVRDMLSYAGFTNTPDCGPWGLFRDSTRLLALPPWEAGFQPECEIMYYSSKDMTETVRTNNQSIVGYRGVQSPFTNFTIVPAVFDSDPTQMVFQAIGMGLKQVGVSVAWVQGNPWVNSNQFEIFIPVKP